MQFSSNEKLENMCRGECAFFFDTYSGALAIFFLSFIKRSQDRDQDHDQDQDKEKDQDQDRDHEHDQDQDKEKDPRQDKTSSFPKRSTLKSYMLAKFLLQYSSVGRFVKIADVVFLALGLPAN